MAISTKDSVLVPYCTNFDLQLTAEPATYFVTTAQASDFTTIRKAYTLAMEALLEARTAGIESKPLVAAKDSAKAAMLPVLRGYYAAIQNNPAISDEAKATIGVHVKKTHQTPTPVPSVRPGMDVVNVFDRTIDLNIHDSASSTKRARAPLTAQAFVYYFVGASYPSDPTLWSFAGAATKSRFQLTLPDSVPAGAQVWVCAAWTNAKGEAGPTNLPISTRIQGGGTATPEAAMKLAA